VLPVSGAPIENGFVAWDRETIIAVGSLAELPLGCPYEPPKPGTLLTPGLINCHLHLEQSFSQPIAKAPDEPFTNWLLKVVGLLQQHACSSEKLQRCKAGVEELLSTGTTCVNDIASGIESVQALADKGLRGIVSLEVFHPSVKPLNFGPWVQRYQEFTKAFEGQSLLQAGLSPHSPYNVSPAAWQALVDACKPALVHTHLAEFADETRYLQGEPSMIQDLHQAILKQAFAPQAPACSAVEYLSEFNLLNAQTIAAHAIEADADDRALLTQAGTAIAHCPRSNLALHGKTLKAADWDGIPKGLGTDGRLSTENLDLRAEARCAQQLHGWSDAQTLAAMTLYGAQALHLEKIVGSLDTGKQADIVLWRANAALGQSPEAQILDAGTTVEEVWIAGGRQWRRTNE
jgi:5-methylthioadenosine/S-adenosylhomocysteine deaminase